MKIQHQEHRKNGAFFIEEDGEWIAELTYIRTGAGHITIDHTEVDEKLRGEGIGEDLVAEAVKYARKSNLRIKSKCPFAKKVLESKAEYQDVLS